MDDRENKDEKKEKDGRDPAKMSRRSFLKGMASGGVAVAIGTLPRPSLGQEQAAALPQGVKEAIIRLDVNDRLYRVRIKSHWTLLDVLRRELGLTGSKMACDRGNCGSCTVIIDGRPVYACSLLAIAMDGKKVFTVEGLSRGESLHPIQKAFSEHGGYQCGYCTPGQMMSAKALLDKNPGLAAPRSARPCPATSAAAGPIRRSSNRSLRHRRLKGGERR